MISSRQWLLAASVFIGLVLPPLAELSAALLYPSLFFIMLFSLLGLDWTLLLASGRRELVTGACLVAVQMLLLPILVVVALRPILDADAVLFLALITSASTIFGAPAFATMLGLSRSLTFVGVIVSTLLLPVSMLLVWYLAGTAAFSFNLESYFLRISLFILLPGILSLLYRKISQSSAFRLPVRVLDGGVFWSLIVFAIAVMDGVTYRILEAPVYMFQLMMAVVVIHVALYLVSRVIFGFLGRETASIAGMLSSYRNLGLLAAVADSMLPDNFMLFVDLWQIPMYVSPLILSMFLY